MKLVIRLLLKGLISSWITFNSSVVAIRMLSELEQANERLVCLGREPDLLKAGDTFPLTGRCSSSDSVKASSGEVSPYDNNSPLLYEYPADSDALADAAPVFSPTRQHGERSRGTSPSLSPDKGEGLFFIHLFISKSLQIKSRILE